MQHRHKGLTAPLYAYQTYYQHNHRQTLLKHIMMRLVFVYETAMVLVSSLCSLLNHAGGNT